MKVLIADDDALSLQLLSDLLQEWGYEVESAKNGSDAWSILDREDSPNIAIVDWMMPNLSGLELCRKVRQKNATPYTYMIIISLKSLTEDIVNAIEAGADDYVCKPYEANELKVRVRAGHRIVDMQRSLLATQQELEFKARHDMLMKIWNRTAMTDLMERELARAKRDSSSFGVMLADVDRFSNVTSRSDSTTGDEILGQVARRIQSFVRPYDSVGRYTDEKFLIICPNCNAEQATIVAERIRKGVSREPVIGADCEVSLTVSLGVTVGDPSIHDDAESILRTAEIALTGTKSAGGGTLVVLSEPRDQEKLTSSG